MKRMTMLLCLLLLTIFGVTAVRAESPYAKADTPLTLFAVNVGKGDALLLNCGADTYLIDAGLQDHWGDLSRALTTLQVERLTGVILTHTDKDHAAACCPWRPPPSRWAPGMPPSISPARNPNTRRWRRRRSGGKRSPSCGLAMCCPWGLAS